MVYNKYPTTFSTHEEFWKILNSIPWKDRSEWVGNLSIELLRMKDDKGWAVAHNLAEYEILPTKYITQELLTIEDNEGYTVAHILADKGLLPEELILSPERGITEELLRMKNSDGWTVAHNLAEFGAIPKEFLTEELLRVKGNDDWTVAHELAENGAISKEFLTEELLRIKDRWGWTVAHALVLSGTLPEELITEELLFLKNDEGMTVAHWLAKSGTMPKEFISSPEQGITEKLFRITNDNGKTVATYHYNYLFINNRWDLLTPAVLEAPCEDKTPMIDKVTEDLSGLNDVKLEEAFSLMSGETRTKLLSDLKNPSLLDRIRKCLDREAETNVFESPSGTKDCAFLDEGNTSGIYSGEREDLYGTEAER